MTKNNTTATTFSAQDETELQKLTTNNEILYGTGTKESSIETAIAKFKQENKKKPISLRLKNTTLEKLQKIAKKQNMPYQTFINVILDDVAEKETA